MNLWQNLWHSMAEWQTNHSLQNLSARQYHTTVDSVTERPISTLDNAFHFTSMPTTAIDVSASERHTSSTANMDRTSMTEMDQRVKSTEPLIIVIKIF